LRIKWWTCFLQLFIKFVSLFLLQTIFIWKYLWNSVTLIKNFKTRFFRRYIGLIDVFSSNADIIVNWIYNSFRCLLLRKWFLRLSSIYIKGNIIYVRQF
jgi:hypothetical protein